MSYLLNLVYLAGLAVCFPWLLFAAVRKGKYREGFAAKFFGAVPIRSGGRKCLWLHAVSVGEVNLLESLLTEIARRAADWECVISTTTMTGFALAKTKYAGYTVFYCPLDFSWAVRRAMRRIRPDVLVLAELELWPNLIRAARSFGAKVAVINGRLSEKSFRGYRRVRPLLARLFGSIDLVAAQNQTYAGRFLALGANSLAVRVTGSLKFDGAQTDRNNGATRRLAALAGISRDDVVFLAGSTQEPEEAFALSTFCKLIQRHPRLRLILVPRHPDRFNAVADMLEKSGVAFLRRSQLVDRSMQPDQLRAAHALPESQRARGEDGRGARLRWRVLLVDAVGELGAWWGTARIAFVGGSLSRRGGQNMIEPAAYGAAVSFGPNTRNFRDIVTLMLEADAARVVHDEEEMSEFVRNCLESTQFADELGERARRLVRGQLGATAQTVDLIRGLLEKPSFSPHRRIDSRHAQAPHAPLPPKPSNTYNRYML